MERDWYRPLENSAMNEGWSLYRLEDGGVLKKPADMMGNLLGQPILLEVKYHSTRNHPTYERKPVLKLSLFEPHQIEALNMWQKNSGFSLSVVVVLSDHFPGEYHVWVNDIETKRSPDAIGKTKVVTTKTDHVATLPQQTTKESFFGKTYMQAGAGITKEVLCADLGKTIQLGFIVRYPNTAPYFKIDEDVTTFSLTRHAEFAVKLLGVK